MKDQKIKTMTTTAMFTAIITVLTACFQIKTVNDGYIHFGDSMIYLASCLLPAPYAVFAASAGGAMADILSGSAVWALPTLIIKALNTLPFIVALKYIKKKDSDRIMTKEMIIMSAVSGVITIVGYWIAEGIMFGFAASTIGTVLRGFIQPVCSSVLFVCVGTVLDRAKFKSLIYRV
ncbi:TIGR04002 family protein [Ruminococcus sp. HUN007]|uniref:TIGR04002 family protein n=1 Tax=Ruminococcus sp. HUN007 TaxID=1514668 RepID=UPI0005D23A1F|nr:TIGR04002 family protein [Ruminococcus sp. HUN007]